MSLNRCVTFLPFLTSHCFVILLILLTFPPFVCPISFSITRFNAEATDILYECDATPSLGTFELNTVEGWDRVGRASSVKPLHLWDSSTEILTDFTTRFSFTIDLQGSDVARGSNGLAFYLAPVDYQIPPNSTSESLGLFNITTRGGVPGNQIVLVEFDIWENFEFDPPVGNHIGINGNSDATPSLGTIELNTVEGWDRVGRASYVKPLHLWDSSTGILTDFTTRFSFTIDLQGSDDAQGSDGLAFYLAPVGYQIPPNSANEHLGLFNGTTRRGVSGNPIVLVEFDTWVNPEFDPPVGKHIGINNNTLGVSFSYLFVTKRKSKKIGSRGNYEKFDLEREALPKRFHYQELLAATNGFANDRRLGQGGSGQVYKGILIDLGRLVAVKRIFPESENSERIFMNEAKIISRLIHRNLVQFIGWCHEKDELLLVYEYMPNGSLDTHLFGNRRTLQWNVKYKIALGLASALHYLHEDAEQCVIHRDIKSANVLLDIDFSPKLGDFGIAKLVDPRLKTQTTGVVGTFGYLAPEYFNHGRATKESDMFSFGVVALEIACGRRTYLDSEGYHVPLAKWVSELYVAEEILNAADERLNMDFDESEMRCLLIVGLWCTNPIDKERPKAGPVMKVLQLEAPLPELRHDMHDYKQALANSIQSASITALTMEDVEVLKLKLHKFHHSHMPNANYKPHTTCKKFAYYRIIRVFVFVFIFILV
ncbi:putative Kinase [Quillaja saponaria]|uniref:Kinase n=1 Tax=Quillaja saponaria TaxID=32244 RepID=A0AAD7PT93_QUISA|nr:putative Kinase [Quillaja saponaria]